jgi:hypothetical protein
MDLKPERPKEELLETVRRKVLKRWSRPKVD